MGPFLLYLHHYVAVREKLCLDVRLLSLYHECFPPSLRVGLRLDVRLGSLYHVSLPPYE
jgi:hypothetical protein